ncbi:hypothetical protein QGN23_00990 [Chryseobacterium gotjawalense]|uniref:Fur-regulated basic protein FbpA n=1 Tax=Chryseobacterium gotjawalense TaxID=3042315 RepID=A0ABY8RD24_9FLAO|nr:hypothetical protein [Chryseobacterium sp. wdc7]WHF51868.1 hypothetical protein QGN23_00990 [Chryseobacterium sp. wdc7]
MMNKNEIEKLLKADEELLKTGSRERLVYESIEKEFLHFAKYDKEIEI